MRLSLITSRQIFVLISYLNLRKFSKYYVENKSTLISKTLKNILVPLDGSNNSIRGLKFALVVAYQSGSSVIGLNIDSHPTFVETTSTVKEETRQVSKNIIKEAESMSTKQNVPFTGMIKVGNNIGKTILTFAESHNVDLIVMGSRGPDPEIELFFGSVANYVVHKSKIPVTIVK